MSSPPGNKRGASRPPPNIKKEQDEIDKLANKSQEYFEDRELEVEPLTAPEEYLYGLKILEEAEKAAGRGNSNAPRVKNTAIRHIGTAADQGFSIAQCKYAKMCLDGVVPGKSAADSKIWFKLAADQGNPEAQYNLATIYGQEGDVDGRMRELEKAAISGHPKAIEELYKEKFKVAEERMAKEKALSVFNRFKGALHGARSAAGSVVGSAVGGVSNAVTAQLEELQRKKERVQEAFEEGAGQVQKGALGLAKVPAAFAGGWLEHAVNSLPPSILGRNVRVNARVLAGKLKNFSRKNNRGQAAAYAGLNAARSAAGLPPTQLEYATARNRVRNLQQQFGQEGVIGARLTSGGGGGGGGGGPSFVEELAAAQLREAHAQANALRRQGNNNKARAIENKAQAAAVAARGEQAGPQFAVSNNNNNSNETGSNFSVRSRKTRRRKNTRKHK